MKNMHIILLSAMGLFASVASPAAIYRLASPAKQVVIEIQEGEGKLTYDITCGNRPVILSSRLLWAIDSVQLGNHVASCRALPVKTYTDRYTLIGGHSHVTATYRQMDLQLKEQSGVSYTLQVRAYDQGIALRYLTTTDRTSLIEDFTTFRLPAGSTCWMQGSIAYYEGEYKAYKAGELPASFSAGPPVTVDYGNGLYASLTEGNLVNFGGMSLHVAEKDVLQAQLFGKTYLKGDVATPWRIVMAGSLQDLVNNDIATDVSSPLAPVFQGKTDWIKPGNCVWSWLAGGGVTYENMKHYTDMAAALHIPYNLIDEGWGHWEGGGDKAWEKIAELVKYGQQKGVQTLVWKAYPDRAGIEGLNTPERLHKFLKRCKEVGIAGCKIDFFDGETQTVTKFYADALDYAAQLGLTIDFHGADKPTGLDRTYPNELTREGILGLEYGHSIPEQDVVTLFTRFVAGHADYTPMTFDPNRMNGTTQTYQMAVSALFLSPLRCYGGSPDDYLKHPAHDFFLGIPTYWDETRVLTATQLGKCAVMARRSGKTWYVAAITTDARNFSLPLNFLSKGKYHATAYSDDKGLTTATYTKNDLLNVRLKAKDGLLLRFELENK